MMPDQRLASLMKLWLTVFSTLCFSTRSSMLPSSYFSTVVIYLIRNSSSFHVRVISFFYTTRRFLPAVELKKPPEVPFDFRKGD